MTDEFACTLTPQYSGGVLSGYCQDCPEIPAIAAVPAVVTTDPHLGWNSSAHSVARFEGDCVTEFGLPAGVVGVVCGLASAHRSSLPRDVDFAVYAYEAAGAQWWQLLERGVAKTSPVLRDPAHDLFRIERRGATVRYFFANRQLYVSATPSSGPLQVVACLYSANDGVL